MILHHSNFLNSVHFLCLQQNNLRCSLRADASENRGVYAPSESIAYLRGTPPNRFTALNFAARLREMAF